MVVSEIARLAHAHRVEHPIWVGALGRVLAPTVLPVAARTHVLTFEAIEVLPSRSASSRREGT